MGNCCLLSDSQMPLTACVLRKLDFSEKPVFPVPPPICVNHERQEFSVFLIIITVIVMIASMLCHRVLGII